MKEEPFVSHVEDVEKIKVGKNEKIYKQWLIGEDKNVNFFMRKFTLEPGEKMAPHVHGNYEHEGYVLKGKLKFTIGGEEHEMEKGNFFLIPDGVPHKGENIGNDKAEFLCIIPAVRDRVTEYLEEE